MKKLLEKLNDPKFHEIVGRTIIQTIKIGLAAAIFMAAQQALYAQSHNLIKSVDMNIANLTE